MNGGGGIRPSAGVVLPLLPPALLHYTINRRKLQAVLQKICAKKVEMLGGVPRAALVRPAAVASAGGLAPALPARRASAIPGGGLARLVACLPCLYLLFCPLSPDPLPQRGRGCPKVYFAGGFAPGTPAFNRLRHLQNLPSRYPAGGLPGWSPAYPAFTFFSAPYPPSPLPQRGRGRLQVISCKGLRPLHPRRLSRKRHLQNLPSKYPAAEIRDCRKNDRKRFPMSSAGSQGEGGPGEMELSVASDGGV